MNKKTTLIVISLAAVGMYLYLRNRINISIDHLNTLNKTLTFTINGKQNVYNYGTGNTTNRIGYMLGVLTAEVYQTSTANPEIVIDVKRNGKTIRQERVSIK